MKLNNQSVSAVLLLLLWASLPAFAQTSGTTNDQSDVLVLSNGDTLHGTLVKEADGMVTFHSDPLGDITVTWDKIKELHAGQNFAVLQKNLTLRGKKAVSNVPTGPIQVANDTVTMQPANQQAPAPIPVKNAQFIVDQKTLEKEAYHEPSFFVGWNGSATGGATLVNATQNQYSFTGAVSLVRVVPTVEWLDPRNRTLVDFTGSFGKITEPSYFNGAGMFVPSTSVKTAIFHADAERDQYVSKRWYVLAMTAFDHNYAQALSLQQIYGGGVGYTALKTLTQELDLRATIQYEKQSFISPPPTPSLNLIGSTFGAEYQLKLKLLTLAQQLAYIAAYNNPGAYSANEATTLTFPTYKNFALSVGTLDSYLNNPPAALPPVKRNSFQFTTGVTYNIKSNY